MVLFSFIVKGTVPNAYNFVTKGKCPSFITILETTAFFAFEFTEYLSDFLF